MRVSSRQRLAAGLILVAGVAAILPARLDAQAAATAAAPAAQQSGGKKELTLERLMSAPPLTSRQMQGIEWAPDGKRFSYLNRTQGGLELWTMDAATGEQKVLISAEALKSATQPEKAKTTQATGLGRVRPDNYLWSPDSGSMLFIGTNSLVLLDLKSMTTKPVVSSSEHEIEDPKFSPDGKWISFSRDANLFVVSLANPGEPKALTTGGTEEVLKGKLDWVYPEELDCRTAYWWSPDSTKIAYYEMDERPVTRYPIMDMSVPTGGTEYTRYPQAGEANPIVRVGVVSVNGGETKWMDTGSNTDVYLARVNWLADSGHVAIQRLNRAQNQLDLLFADAASGASKNVLTESDKYWINISDDLYFFSDGKKFLWSSERTGFRHFYLYGTDGKQIAQLTKGDWAVADLGGFGPGAANHPSVDEKNGYVYFLANKNDPRETDAYRVSLADQKLTQITKEAGAHGANISPTQSAFIDTYSNITTPTSQTLRKMDGSQVAVMSDGKVPALADYALTPTELVELKADDGTKLYASMVKPVNFDPTKKYPVLINVYGGPHVQLVRNSWGGVRYLLDELYAQKGVIVWTLDNRGSWGRGHAFETPIYHQMGKVELQDQMTGIAYLKSLGYVDPARIGITGGSYGGYMTLEALFNTGGAIKVGVSDAPVTDWKLYDTIYTERYMGTPQNNPDGYKNSSPVNQAADIKGLLMLVHGTGDDNVHFANSVELLNALIDSGHYPDKLMVFPGRGHGISDVPARMLLQKQGMDYILNHL